MKPTRKNRYAGNLLALTVGLSALFGLSGCAEEVEVASTPEERQALQTRIRPVVVLDDLKSKPEPAPAPAAEAALAASAESAAPTPAASDTVADAKPLYDKACMACHSTGAAGAPMLGDKAAWEQRLNTAGDVAGLVASAKTGKGAMPPNGGSAYSEDEMRQVIEFMLAEAGLN